MSIMITRLDTPAGRHDRAASSSNWQCYESSRNSRIKTTFRRALMPPVGKVAVDLLSLQYALLVQAQGSFRQAAELLAVRPSVVSRRVRSFEDAIGVGLFQRQSQGARPTLAGRRILRRGQGILDEIDYLLRTAATKGSGREGNLRIGFVSSLAGGMASVLLKAFLSAHPDVELDIVEGAPRDHVTAVRGLRMDVTFVVGMPSTLGCEVEPLWSESINVALGTKHALAVSESVRWNQLSNSHFIVPKTDPGPEIHDFIVRHLAALGHHPLVESCSVFREGLMAMVGLGLGITLVGTAEAAVTYPGVIYRRLEGEVLPFSAVWSANNDNPALRRFLSLARIEMQKQRSS